MEKIQAGDIFNKILAATQARFDDEFISWHLLAHCCSPVVLICAGWVNNLGEVERWNQVAGTLMQLLSKHLAVPPT
jgi:hypothetical protein